MRERDVKASGARGAEGDSRLNAAGRKLLATLWGAVALFTLGMLAAGWPRYWAYVAAETTPQAWLESVLLVLAAAIAGLNAFAAVAERGDARELLFGEEAERRAEKVDSLGRGSRSSKLTRLVSRYEAWGWSITAAAFAWLALDERFAVHERLRDRYLKRTGIRLLPWMEAGDWLIPLYAVCGLAFVWVLWRLLGKAKTPRLYFAAALLLAFCAVSLDTIDIRSLSRSSERLLQTIEECLETAAMTAFVSAFLSVLTGRLSAWYNKTSIRREDPY